MFQYILASGIGKSNLNVITICESLWYNRYLFFLKKKKLTSNGKLSSCAITSQFIFYTASVIAVIFNFGFMEGKSCFVFAVFDFNFLGVFQHFSIKFPHNLRHWIASEMALKLGPLILFCSSVFDFLGEFCRTSLFWNM